MMKTYFMGFLFIVNGVKTLSLVKIQYLYYTDVLFKGCACKMLG